MVKLVRIKVSRYDYEAVTNHGPDLLKICTKIISGDQLQVCRSSSLVILHDLS